MTARRTIGRSARIAAAAAATGAVGLALVGVGATAAQAQIAPADGPEVDCLSAPAHARVGLGIDPDRDPDSLSAAEVRANEQALKSALRSAGKIDAKATVTVPVVFNVITKRDGTGDVKGSQLVRQIKVMNQAYGGRASRAGFNAGFRFTIADVVRTANNDWYDWHLPAYDRSDRDEQEAKDALHQGGLETLNVYVTGLQDNLLGYATFPGTVPEQRDGVVILNESLPGGAAKPYNQGDTLAHEAGHWLNLYHTFQGGCSKKNDRVKDTPRQNDGENVFSCKEKLDTCKAKGRDPVHNYMSYGTDKCLDRFTRGQAIRMKKSYQSQRA